MPRTPARRRARRPLAAAAAALALLLLAACGGGDDDDAAADAGASGGASGFPVTVEHKFGSTTIPSAPQRVVALGYTELDYALALGVTPVAARYPQFGPTDTAVRPWAAELAGDADVQVLEYAFGAIDTEAVAALQPDLVLAVTSGITQAEYDALSRFAPVVAQTDDYIDFGMPWQDTTRLIGQALGQPERAEELVADLEAEFAAAREEHPELEGLEVASASYGANEVFVFAADDLRARFFTDLGMVVPAEVEELAGDAFFGSLSLERLDLVDRDVLVWSQLQFTEGGREAIEADPLVQALAATREGRTVFIGGEADDALQVSTVLSLPTALEGVLPLLEAATDGDPATRS